MTRTPPFAATFPPHPALQAALRAFTVGDYADTAKRCRAILSDSPEEDVKVAAQSLLERTRPDPWIALLMAMSILLLAGLSAFYWLGHSH